MYRWIQCIGVNVRTGRFDYRVKQCREDSAQRLKDGCDLLKHYIDTAVRNLPTKNSPSVLKIFMAPEYFFQTWDTVYHPVENLSIIPEEMRQLTREKRFEDWIFVHGTAVGYLDTGQKREIHNTAFVQRGGAIEDGLTDCIVYKEFPVAVEDRKAVEDLFSPFNGGDKRYPTTGIAGARPVVRFGPSPTETPSDRSEVNRSGFGGGGIFTMAGVRFGLEICVDHWHGRLARYISGSDDPGIQVLLMPCCGMRFQNRTNVPEERRSRCHDLKGTVFNVDGGNVESRLHTWKNGEMTEVFPVIRRPFSLGQPNRALRVDLSLFEPVPIEGEGS